MKAFISALSDGHSRIEFVDEYGNTLDIYEVDTIHVELYKENIESLTRLHMRSLKEANAMYDN